MLVAGLDLETTGLSVESDHIIEIGIVLWDTARGVPVRMFSSLVVSPGLQKLEPRITELTGITDADLERYGNRSENALQFGAEMLGSAEAVVAHNGNQFDRPMLENNAARNKVKIPEKLWIDTSCDIEFPLDIQTRKLKHLASEHGFLNPFAHRALFDVLTMLTIAQKYDWAKIVEYAKTPTISVRAHTTYDQRELAKKLNYRWNGEKKLWTKSIKQFQYDDEKKAADAAGFKVSVIPEEKKNGS